MNRIDEITREMRSSMVDMSGMSDEDVNMWLGESKDMETAMTKLVQARCCYLVITCYMVLRQMSDWQGLVSEAVQETVMAYGKSIKRCRERSKPIRNHLGFVTTVAKRVSHRIRKREMSIANNTAPLYETEWEEEQVKLEKMYTMTPFELREIGEQVSQLIEVVMPTLSKDERIVAGLLAIHPEFFGSQHHRNKMIKQMLPTETLLSPAQIGVAVAKLKERLRVLIKNNPEQK